MSKAPGGGPSAGPPGGREASDGPSASEFAGVGLQFAASIIVFLLAGQWLDRKLGTAPWLLIIGVFLGAGASVYSMYRKLMPGPARGEAARKDRSDRGMGRGLALYALASVVAIGLAAGVFVAVYPEPLARQAVLVSAIVALAV